MCGKPGYSTENTPSKKTSLRWGDDCPNISLADTNFLAAISSSSSFVAKSVVISFKGKKYRNHLILLNYIQINFSNPSALLIILVLFFSYSWSHHLPEQTRESPQWIRYLCYKYSNNK